MLHLNYQLKQRQFCDHLGPRHCHTYSETLMNDGRKQHFVTATYTNLQHANYQAMNRKSTLKQKEQKKTAGPLRHRRQKQKNDHQRHRNQAQNAREGGEEKETGKKKHLAQDAQAEDIEIDETTDGWTRQDRSSPSH